LSSEFKRRSLFALLAHKPLTSDYNDLSRAALANSSE